MTFDFNEIPWYGKLVIVISLILIGVALYQWGMMTGIKSKQV